MKRSLSAATGLFVTLPVVLTAPAAWSADAAPAGSPGARVVADRLDNPRQLNWDELDNTLIIAEAGRGGTTCIGEGEGQQCAGLTGAVSTVRHPHRQAARQRRAVSGLLSIAGPNGAFAVGSNGADATDVREEYVVAVTDIPPGALPPGTQLPGADQLGQLVVSGKALGKRRFVLPYADIAAAEAEQNPDGAQIESNPYAVLFVEGDGGTPDGYALIADAAANTVWKVQPRLDEATDDEPPPYDITVFATYPTVEEGPGEQGPPEFVPTSLAMDEAGHVFVGGLGSEVAGAASVVEYDPAGDEVRRFTGFTGVVGVAVDDSSLYVSQIFGSTPPGPPGDEPSDEAPSAPTAAPGSVVKTSRATTDATRYEVDVPLPGGLATDDRGNVYVSAYSTSPATGVEDAFGPGSFDLEGGQVWDIHFRGARTLPPATAS